jgi:hypothetical protein
MYELVPKHPPGRVRPDGGRGAGERAEHDPLAGLRSLQRAAGNAAVSSILHPHPVQRDPAPPPDNIAKLDELLDRWLTPEKDVIALLGAMTAPEKQKVLAGYRDKLAKALNFAEMRQAVQALGPVLAVKLEWLEKAALVTRGINYFEIRDLVMSATQAEREVLKTERWKAFFLSVCDNFTIVMAAGDLGFDLPTQLTWIRGEASGLFALNLTMLKPLLQNASAADLAVVGGDFWRPFWLDVCTNETMPELVDLLFPNNLRRKLEWMAAEGSSLPAVRAKVAATADAAQRSAVLDSLTVRMSMVWLCNDAEMISFVLDLGGDWPKWKPWAQFEGAPLRDLALEAMTRRLVPTDPLLAGFLGACAGKVDKARDYVRDLSDADVARLKVNPIVMDVATDAYGGDAEQVKRALDGELARVDKEVSTEETLLTGDPKEPFKEQTFGGDNRFELSFWRDRVQVDVGVRIKPDFFDERAETLLPAAKTIWSAKINGAWDNKFQITNGTRTIPMRFHVNLDADGPNTVTAHSGEWVWPKLNAGNWFVPDHDEQPGQERAVSEAPIHEFGHLIGNLDEYWISADHYVQVTGKDPKTDPNAVPETDKEGTTRYTNQVSLMGSGTQVLQNHVKGILDIVNDNRRSGDPAYTFK